MEVKATNPEMTADPYRLDQSSLSPVERFRRSNFARAVRSNPIAVLGVFLVCLFLIASAFPGLFTRSDYSPTALSLKNKLLPPSAKPTPRPQFWISAMWVFLYHRRINVSTDVIPFT